MNDYCKNYMEYMFQTYSICTLLLFVKYFAVLIYAVDSTNRPQEDSILPGANSQTKRTAEDQRRVERILENDKESLPIHLIILWAALLVQNYCFATSGTGDCLSGGLTVLMATYTGLRYLFTFFYAYGLQPWRTISFLLSTQAVAVVACLLVAFSFKIDYTTITNKYAM